MHGVHDAVVVVGATPPRPSLAADSRPALRPADGGACGTLTLDMPLEEYRRKRDFKDHPEPPPDVAGDKRSLRQVRRPAPSRHATPLRLPPRDRRCPRLVGRPQGPTLDPGRRMAVHVEDHPIEYFDFEGVIPAKQYGAGDVIVWDWGTWEPEAPTLDGRKAVQDGELKFRLNGRSSRAASRSSGRAVAAAVAPSRATTATSGCSSTRPTTRRGPAGTPRTTRRASRPVAPMTRSRRTATRSDRPGPRPSRRPRRCQTHADAPEDRADGGDARDQAVR